jgi:hypothetical protein
MQKIVGIVIDLEWILLQAKKMEKTVVHHADPELSTLTPAVRKRRRQCKLACPGSGMVSGI